MKAFLSFPFLVFGLLAESTWAQEKSPRPNILYFYVDDMGWGSIGPNGQAERKAKGLPYVKTPNLDKLAAEGVNFRRGYGCHVCSPARSSQQSGFHQGHTFADRNDPDNAKKAMRADDILMGDALSAAGYTTGYWGKWGYGGSKDLEKPTIDNVQTLPTSHGYQFVLAELHHVRAHTFFQPTLWSAPAEGAPKGNIQLEANTLASYQKNPSYPNYPANQNHTDYPKPAYCDDLYAFRALDFVRENALAYNETGKPFFGLLAVQIPHAPFAEITRLPDWDSAYRDEPWFSDLPDQAKQWAAMVTRIDAHFGNILAALEDPNNDGDKSDSVAGNTLVVFQSDNGGPAGANNGVFDANGGLRGNKGKIEEGGIRVPLLMRWTDKINAGSKLKAGASTDKVVDVTDLLPTFCEVAGAQIPLGIDGVSIAPTLSGDGQQRERDFIVHEAGNGQSIIRGEFKLVRSGGAAAKPRKKDGAKANPEKASYVLYNLRTDHSEENDIAAKHPELVAVLKQLLLGERVAEPRGFANTYHHFTGGDGAVTSDPNNWSDYEYANEGVSYMTDKGAPQLSWTAHIVNGGRAAATARADADLEFLGLEIRGGEGGAAQSLALGKGINLTARNELRLSAHSKLIVNGGTVLSLRWVDVLEGAELGGSGSVEATVFNAGKVTIDSDKPLKLSGYTGYDKSEIHITLPVDSPVPLQAKGEIRLNGRLVVKRQSSRADQKVKPVTIITAERIAGRFEDDVIFDNLGNQFRINYSANSVYLTLMDREELAVN